MYNMTTEELNMDYSKYDFKDSTELYVYLSKKGLSRGTVEEISKLKGDPDWMRDFRLRSYDVFMSKPMPDWGGDLSKIDFQNIYYYAKAAEKPAPLQEVSSRAAPESKASRLVSRDLSFGERW